MDDPRQKFGLLVRQRREEQGIPQTALARTVKASQSTISRVESSDTPIPPELPSAFDQALGTDGEFKRLYEEIVASSFPARHRRRMAAERVAIAIAEWSPSIVPGMFQSDRYARAIIGGGSPRATEEEINRTVVSRLDRRDVLESENPPDIRMVLCESVVRRRIGGPEVMREQLALLLKLGEHPTVRLQVLPLDSDAHLFVDYPVSILTGPNHVPVVYGETYRTAGVVEDPEEVRAALRAYDEITGEALSTRQSARLITDLMERL